MNDKASEFLRVGEEWFSDPEEVAGALLVERTIRMYAGVHVKPMAVIVKEGKGADPFDVSGGQLRGT
jgi:hypothetical protein